MTGKEALMILKDEIKRIEYFKKECNSCIPDNVIEAYHLILNNLEVLNIFEKYLSIVICKKLSIDETYYVLLKDNDKDTDDYMGIFVNEEEKDLLKRWSER